MLPVDDPERYKQIAEHARGGLGRIVRAVDRRLGRTVAVKELLRRDDSHEARFMREALITARLEHPGIVPVHEAGRWPNGDPYYVMKLVEGRTLKELMAQHHGLRERIALLPHVIAVADAVGYAHSEGVIHRDIKPSNVIVGAFGETIVVDWGLARDSKHEISEPTEEDLLAHGSGVSTVSGKIVGTPAYMAPEQARGDLVDPRADVYAIGAVLYELLAGKAPHADETPEAVLDRVLAGPPMPLAVAAPNVPSELADLVAKAMARDPADRYANATLLAEDLRRFQTGKLVSAHAYTPWALIRKKLAQHRGVVAVAVASAVALAAVGVESFHRVLAERDIAEVERARAVEAGSAAELNRRELVLVQARTSLQKDPTAALAWLKVDQISEHDLVSVVDVIDDAVARGVARYVFRPGDWVLDAVFTPDGKTVIAAVRDGVVRAYDLTTGKVRELGRTPSFPWALAISPDGNTVVTGGVMGDITAWPVNGGPPKRLVEHGKACTRLAFDATGKWIVVDRGGRGELVGLDGTLVTIGPTYAQRVAIAAHDLQKRVALVAPNQVAVVLPDGSMRQVAQTERAIQWLGLSPSGELILIHDGVSVWTVPFSGGTPTKLADFDAVLNDVVWTADGKTLALIGKRPDIVLVDAATRQVRELRGHTDAIYTAEFTRDGHELLTASDDGTARVWDLSDGSSTELLGHDDDVVHARLSPDERFAVTASLDGSLRVWPIARDDAKIYVESSGIESLELAADHAIVSTKASVSSWDLVTGTRQPLATWSTSLGAATSAFGMTSALASPDGELAVTLGTSWTLEVHDASGGSLPLKGHRALISHVEWSRDGEAVFSSSYDGTLRRWDPVTGASTTLISGDVPVRGFALAADGRIVAQVGDAVKLLAADGTIAELGKGTPWCMMHAEFEHVRDRLVFERCDNSEAMWDGTKVVELPNDGFAVVRIAVSPDGKRIAGALDDRTIRVWSADNGEVMEKLRGHDDLVEDVAFSPDGSQLASASYDKTIRVWQLESGRHRVLRGHSAGVTRIVWHGADELVSASSDGTLRVWPVPDTEPPTPAQVVHRLDAATTARIDAENRATSSSG
ncbi:MAG TPA: protein kinase [Kofleriaceae bacterium]|jgi:WD40 repeat protein